MKKTHPKARKGKKRKYPVTCVAWIDLLGYGAMLEKVGFRPDTHEAENAVARLNEFHRIVVDSAHKTFQAMPINDGAVFFRDLTDRSRWVTYDFVRNASIVHEKINQAEKKLGLPGARMIIATGFRMLGKKARMDDGHRRSIMKRLSAGEIETKQAITEAFMARPVAGFVPHLQANFAFTKAYLADAGGSKAGLGGPACYVDLMLFSDPCPNWIEFDGVTKWSDRGLSVDFGKLKHIDASLPGNGDPPGVLDADEIAKRLRAADRINTKGGI